MLGFIIEALCSRALNVLKEAAVDGIFTHANVRCEVYSRSWLSVGQSLLLRSTSQEQRGCTFYSSAAASICHNMSFKSIDYPNLTNRAAVTRHLQTHFQWH